MHERHGDSIVSAAYWRHKEVNRCQRKHRWSRTKDRMTSRRWLEVGLWGLGGGREVRAVVSGRVVLQGREGESGYEGDTSGVGESGRDGVASVQGDGAGWEAVSGAERVGMAHGRGK